MSPLNITQPLGIWSIMATIRWCPIFPKWDSYQPLFINYDSSDVATCPWPSMAAASRSPPACRRFLSSASSASLLACSASACLKTRSFNRTMESFDLRDLSFTWKMPGFLDVYPKQLYLKVLMHNHIETLCGAEYVYTCLYNCSISSVTAWPPDAHLFVVSFLRYWCQEVT